MLIFLLFELAKVNSFYSVLINFGVKFVDKLSLNESLLKVFDSYFI